MLSLLKRIKKQVKELDTAVNQKTDNLQERKAKTMLRVRIRMRTRRKLKKQLKKGAGRPKDNFHSKRVQYFEMIKSKKIKEPKEQTLEYYKINHDKATDTCVLLEIE